MSVRRWVVPRPGRDDAPLGVLKIEVVPAEAHDRLREAARRVLSADMAGVRDLDALNALEDAAGFSQQGHRPTLTRHEESR